jgi:arabinogalactan endo-1,4-beta-galactosidase
MVTRRFVLEFALAGTLTTALGVGSQGASAAPTLGTLSKKTSRPELQNGIDISWLPVFEDAGGKLYTAGGKRIDAFALMRANGVRIARIRVFVNPSYRNGTLADALALAKRAKKAGMDFCVDLHLSDDWADPHQQTIPAAWSSTDIDILATQVAEYVSATLQAFKDQGTSPTFVQLGNEITNGMLWPLGQISSNSEQQWTSFANLYGSATDALRRVLPQATNLIHIPNAPNSMRWWLSQAIKYGINGFDVVGISYYSQWSGGLSNLSETLKVVTTEYRRPVLIAETAYPWTNRSFGGDVLKPGNSILAGYPLTTVGQARYLRKIDALLKSQPANRGLGVWWWEGLAGRVSANGQLIWDSGMTNSTLISNRGRALPALEVLGRK